MSWLVEGALAFLLVAAVQGVVWWAFSRRSRDDAPPPAPQPSTWGDWHDDLWGGK